VGVLPRPPEISRSCSPLAAPPAAPITIDPARLHPRRSHPARRPGRVRAPAAAGSARSPGPARGSLPPRQVSRQPGDRTSLGASQRDRRGIIRTASARSSVDQSAVAVRVAGQANRTQLSAVTPLLSECRAWRFRAGAERTLTAPNAEAPRRHSSRWPDLAWPFLQEIGGVEVSSHAIRTAQRWAAWRSASCRLQRGW
jgi:hypothetical protein